MLVSKKTIMGVLALGISMPMIAFSAQDLMIHNTTNQDSTSIINSGFCSTILSGGVTKAHTDNLVSSSTIAKACLFNKTDCKAVVYMSSNCSGTPIATIHFNSTSAEGIKEDGIVPNPDSTGGYTIRRDAGWEVTIGGGPA